MRVLLVDDDAFSLTLLSRQLESIGVEDIVMHDQAKNALALLTDKTERIDLVFCDLQMPVMDGVEFVRYLARIGYAGELVLVSGEDARILHTVENLARSHRLNVLGILHKPASQDQIKGLLSARQGSRLEAMPPVSSQAYRPSVLRRAIAGGELVNYYQPKVALHSGRIEGVETLVRWQHPRDGLIFPDRFIATAEEHGLIHDLTFTVLSEALRQARVWMDDGLSLRVAVNVSMSNLTSLEFPEQVMQCAAEAGVDLKHLVLEVTESRMMSNPVSSLDILSRLRLKHISLSIDDFGTGHSSLSQLRDVPFDELKIDRSFVHGACRDSSLRAILEGSLGMARELGMRAVAEGVEDRDDWEFLCEAGCDLAQGYYIARPMPANNLRHWIEEWSERVVDMGVAVV